MHREAMGGRKVESSEPCRVGSGNHHSPTTRQAVQDVMTSRIPKSPSLRTCVDVNSMKRHMVFRKIEQRLFGVGKMIALTPTHDG